jgi:phosphoribosylaminoimidazole carboxylase PurK protein
MKKRIGIVGGGQLGRMLAQAAHKLGFLVTVLDPTPDSPAGQIADAQIIGSFKDKDKIFELADVSDFITFEIESANAEALEELIAHGKAVNPEPRVLKIIKDKFEQKVFLREYDIPVADFALIENVDDCIKQGEIFGYPFLLKARFDAYDGRGNAMIKSKDDIENAFEKLSKSPLYAERFVPFIKELAVVSARGMDGEIITFPVVETIHKNNICHIVRSPAPVDHDIITKAKGLAEKVLGVLGGVGVFAIEMFLTKSGELLLNEIAPRVHNSGHHTIEAFNMSQFEAHIRAVTGMPLVAPEATSRASVMVNILGEREGKALLDGAYSDNGDVGTSVHIYGKLETRPERKMGHITVLADTLEEAEQKALEIRKRLEI